MSDKTKAFCECGKWIVLKNDGTFYSHTTNHQSWAGAPYNTHCEQSGRKP